MALFCKHHTMTLDCWSKARLKVRFNHCLRDPSLNYKCGNRASCKWLADKCSSDNLTNLVDEGYSQHHWLCVFSRISSTRLGMRERFYRTTFTHHIRATTLIFAFPRDIRFPCAQCDQIFISEKLWTTLIQPINQYVTLPKCGNIVLLSCPTLNRCVDLILFAYFHPGSPFFPDRWTSNLHPRYGCDDRWRYHRLQDIIFRSSQDSSSKY